jgi:hypothetical protein
LYNSLAADFDGTGTNYLSSDGAAFGIQDEISLGAWVNMDEYIAPPSTFAVNSADLNETSQYFELQGDKARLNIGLDVISVSSWVYVSNKYTQIYVKNSSSTQERVTFWVKSDNKVKFLYCDHDEGNILDIQFNTGLSLGWNHVVYYNSRSSASDGGVLYVNGQNWGGYSINNQSGSPHLHNYNDTTGSFRCGLLNIPNFTGYSKTGVFTGVAIGKELTQADATYLYNLGQTQCWDLVGSSNPILYAKFYECFDLGTYNGSTELQALTGKKNGWVLSNINNAPFTNQGLTVECDAGAPAATVQGIIQKGEIDTEGYTMSRRIENGENLIDFNLVTGTSTSTTVSSTDLATGQWKFLAATYNNVEGLMRLYVDGVNVATSANIAANMNVSANDLLVGNLNTLNGLFQGCMMFPFVANKKFIDSQISLMYNGGNPIRYEDLEIDSDVTTDMVGHWNLADWNNGAHTGNELVNNAAPAITEFSVNTIDTNETSQYLELQGDTSSFNIGTNTISVNAWFYWDGSRVEIANKYNGSNASGYSCRMLDTGQLSMHLQPGPSINTNTFEANVTPVNGWNHAVIYCERNAPSDGSKIYLNGVNIIGAWKNPYNTLYNYDNNEPLRVGAIIGSSGSLTYRKPSVMLGIAIGQVLTQSDATYLYNNGTPLCWDDVETYNPTLYAKFDETFDLGTYNGSTETQALTGHKNGSVFDNINNAPFVDQGLTVECETPMTNDLVDNGSIPFNCTGVDVASNEPVNP